MGLNEYERWTLDKPIEELFSHNQTGLNDKEVELLRKVAPVKLLDIGCGNGQRLFSYLDGLGIDYVGLEKFEKLVRFEGNQYSDKIIVADILDIDAKNPPAGLSDIDTITILGGSLAGYSGLSSIGKRGGLSEIFCRRAGISFLKRRW